MIKIGTSGFSFPDWKGKIYPRKIKPNERLPYYEHELGLNCCELNYTFYRQPIPYTMEILARRTGKDFEFTIKGLRKTNRISPASSPTIPEPLPTSAISASTGGTNTGTRQTTRPATTIFTPGPS